MWLRKSIRVAAVLLTTVFLSQGVHAQTTAPRPPADFSAFLDRVDAAQLELQNGRPAQFKALWSHADDVTLSGGLGGAIEKGWDAVSRRLDWVGTQFSNGVNRNERVVVNVIGDLGYVIQRESLKYRVPGQTTDSTREYRVTMIFRRETGEWRMIHRQADSLTVKQLPAHATLRQRSATRPPMTTR